MKQHATKIAPISDDRNKIVTVWDTAGNPFLHTYTNARELVRHLNFTLDPMEAARRSETPVKAAVIANDGTPEATKNDLEKQTETPTIPVWEDLTSIPVDVLRKAAAYLKLPDIDGRSSVKRIVATLDSLLDQTLSASGDFTGASTVSDTASADEKANALEEAIARRRRAFSLAAQSTGVAFGEQTSLVQLVNSIAALVGESTTE